MTQYARPDADTSVGNWSASSGSNRYAMVDEASTDDSDYITVTDSYSGGEAITLSLSSVTDPASGSGHSVVVRFSEDSSMDAVTLNVNLKDGGSSIKNEDFSGSSTANHTMTLSTAQANNISESGYGNLALVLTATDGGGIGSTSKIYQAYFACPDASSSTPIAAIAMNTYRQMRG